MGRWESRQRDGEEPLKRQFLKRVQECHQVVELLLIEDNVEWRHVATSDQDGIANVLVSGRHPAWESLLPKHTNQRRTLQRLFCIRVVTNGAARFVDVASLLFLYSKRARR